MDLIFKITNNVIASLVSIIFLICIKNRLDNTDKKNLIYMIMFSMNTVEIIVETITCIIDKKPLTGLILAAKILNMILFILGPAISCMWFLFVYVWIYEGKFRIYNLIKRVLFFLPLIVNTIFVVLTLNYDFVFKITENNVYVREPMIAIPVFCAYFYMTLSLIYIFINRNGLLRMEFFPLVMALVMGSIAGIIQLLFPGMLVVWSVSAYAFVIIYTLFQYQMSQIDVLTGAWMRSELENYLNNRMKKNSFRGFSIVFIDLNKFKNINDTYGHREGDRALITAVKLIKTNIRKDDFVTRYGGDEFIIFLNLDDKEMIESIIHRIIDSFNKYNKISIKNYKLSFSYGYEIYNFDRHMTVKELINHVDKLMYENKKNSKFYGSSIL